MDERAKRLKNEKAVTRGHSDQHFPAVTIELGLDSVSRRDDSAPDSWVRGHLVVKWSEDADAHAGPIAPSGPPKWSVIIIMGGL